MSVQAEISRISQNIANTYAVLDELGATMPAARTSDNLATTAGSLGIVPDYWRAELEAKAATIQQALDAAGEDRSAFWWYTDAHWTTNYGKSPVLLKYLSKHTAIRKTFFGGDAAVEKTGELDVLTSWLEHIGEVPNHRSMIGNHDDNCTDFATVAEKAEFFLQTNRTEDMAFGTHATNGKMYYYVDSHQEKTRYICLSTGTMWTNADEVEWCIEVLNSTPKNWHIVILSHLWLNNDYSNGGAIITTPVDYTQGYLDMFDSYNYRLSGTESFTGKAYDFVNAGGKIEFIVGGHVHRDYDFATARGIPVILTDCDSWQTRSGDSTTKGTTAENCVYGVIADYNTNMVHIINVGRGHTRSIAIPKVVTYKNLLPIATAPTGGIYNGIGYKTGTRLSVSSGAWDERSESGWCTSGIIPAVAGDTVRLKNCKFARSNTSGGSHRGGVYGVNADGTYSGQKMAMSSLASGGEHSSPVFDTDNDNIIQFNVPANLKNIVGIRIVAQQFATDSIITVNQEIG